MSEKLDTPTLEHLCAAYSAHYEAARRQIREARAAIDSLMNTTLPKFDEVAYAIHQRLRRDLDEQVAAKGKDEREQCAELRRVLSAVRAACMRDPLFRQFTEQEFWHAHHVDIEWRHDGRDRRYEADWLKDVWYALRGKPR